MEEQNHTENPNPSPELLLCRLCGKQKKKDEFRSLSFHGRNALIKYAGCHACATVIHNATVIVKETLDKFIADEPKIIKPDGGIVGPRS